MTELASAPMHRKEADAQLDAEVRLRRGVSGEQNAQPGETVRPAEESRRGGEYAKRQKNLHEPQNRAVLHSVVVGNPGERGPVAQPVRAHA